MKIGMPIFTILRESMQLKRAILFVKDLATMTAFYRDRLGLRVIESASAAGWVEFHGGLALPAIPEDIARGIEITSLPKCFSDLPS